MELNKMYKDKIPDEKLATLDTDYQRVLQSLIQKTQDGSWTLNQQKRQRSSILPRIALYKTFLQYSIEKEKAIELTRERAEYLGNKANKVLKTCFAFPCFSTIFRNVFRKSMNGTEIWTSQFLKDNKKELDINIYKCLWKDTCDYFGCPELCELFCSGDWIVFGNIRRLTLNRTQTLGTGGNVCDFRFRFS